MADGGLFNHKGTAKHGDYAYLPGTGDGHCERCGFYVREGEHSTRGRCRKAADLRQCSLHALKPILGSTPACKYFARAA